MKRISTLSGALLGTFLALAAGTAFAAGADLGETTKQATNWTAIVMFGGFVLATLGSPNGPLLKPNLRLTSTPQVAASPVSKTAWRLLATTCLPLRSSASPLR